MSGCALLVALALAGADEDRVEFSWRTTEDNQVEYTIQIPPAIARLVADGEEIHSPVAAEAGQVQRLCVRIGKVPAPHSAASVQRFRELIAPAARVASRPPGAGDTQAVIWWPAQGLPQAASGVTYGWKPDPQGKPAYYLQIEPAVLAALKEGDEVHATIDPAAGSMATFVVLSGNRPLPRMAPTAAEQTPRTTQTHGGTSQIGTGLASAQLGQTPFPPAGQFGSSAGAATLPPSTQPPASRIGQYEQPPSTAGTSQATAPPLYPDSAPPGTGFGGGGQTGAPPRYSTSDDPSAYAARNRDPSYSDPRGYGGYNQGYDAGRTALQRPHDAPPPAGYAPPAASDPLRQGQFNAQAEQATDNRFASLPPQTLATTAAPAGSTVIPPATTGAPAAAEQWWWPYWLLLMFSLFLSIGVNLYLGWTTAEYYNRYRVAVDRLRSASRGS
jgi:hypothetical protein